LLVFMTKYIAEKRYAEDKFLAMMCYNFEFRYTVF